MKKLAATLMSLIMIVGMLSACGGDTSTPTTGNETGTSGETSGETTADTSGGGKNTELTISVATSPETIDPHKNSSSDGGTYLIHLNEGLYRWNWKAGEGVELGLAEKVEESTDDDGNLTLTITLREDALWSDGQQVTANDFEYSFKRFVNPETGSPYAEDMGGFLLNGAAVAAEEMDVEELGVTALDERTLQVTFQGYCAFYDEILAFPTFMPVRQDIIEEYGDTWTRSADSYITAGPYKMVEFSSDEFLSMEISDTYYDKDALVATSLTWQFLDDDAALSAFQSGEISFRRNIPIDEKEAMKSQDLVYTSPLLGTYYLSFNMKTAPYDDVNVRKALTLAIDRQYISEIILSDTGTPAEAFVGYGFTDENGAEFRETSNTVSFYSAASADYDAQVEEAKAALAEAGYADGEGFPTLEYMYNSGSTQHELVAQALQNMWQESLGIKVELVAQEWNVFLQTRRDGGFEVARNGWISDYNDPLSLLALFMSTSGNNDGKFNNAEFDALVNTAMTSADNAERMQAMRDAEDILIGAEWALAPIYYYTQDYLVDSNLNGWTVLSVGYELMHTAYIAE